MDHIYINDIGIINSQASGKEAVLRGILGGERSFSSKKIDDVSYSVGYCTRDSDDKRIISILKQSCEEISPTVNLLSSKYGRDRIAVILGSTDNGSEESLRAHRAYIENGSFPEGYTLNNQQADFPVEFVKKYFELSSLSMAVSTACTSSAGAIVMARNMLLAGVVDAVIAGGADIVSDSVLKGFIALEAVDPSDCNPFSKNRKGINLGEGASLLVLSRDNFGEESIVLAGCAECSDAHHITAPDPEGSGAAAAMKAALDDAGVQSLDYINLHGTGTALNDAMEARATDLIFESLPPASSTKSMIGHTLGAAGAMELGICWLLMSSLNEKKQLPPHLWDGEADDSFPELELCSNGMSVAQINTCMSNSYAFGGSNVSLVIIKDLS